MPAATILFTDIVKFSRRDTATQVTLIEDLSREVQHEIRDLLSPARREPEAIVLPTGDGMAVAFLREQRPRWDFNRVLRLAVRLLRWGDSQVVVAAPNGGPLKVQLRIGIHEGSVEYVSDINGRTNICGDRINHTQRVMDAANDGQILVSDEAVREYLGGERGPMPLHAGLKVRFEGPYDVLAKHGRRLSVYSAVVVGAGERPLNENMAKEPVSKNEYTLALSLQRDALGVEESFRAGFRQATQIALIQLTGKRLIGVVESGELAVAERLTEFRIYMPKAESLAGREAVVPVDVAGELPELTRRWRDYLCNVRARHPKARVKLGLFDYPPFFGASFFNWNVPPAAVHISPFVWGVPANKHPAFDISWEASPRPELVEAYLKGLETLDNGTSDVL